MSDLTSRFDTSDLDARDEQELDSCDLVEIDEALAQVIEAGAL